MEQHVMVLYRKSISSLICHISLQKSVLLMALCTNSLVVKATNSICVFGNIPNLCKFLQICLDEQIPCNFKICL